MGTVGESAVPVHATQAWEAFMASHGLHQVAILAGAESTQGWTEVLDVFKAGVPKVI